MPTCIRKDGKARRISIDILGIPISGYADSSGKMKKRRKKSGTNDDISKEEEANFQKNESYGQTYEH